MRYESQPAHVGDGWWVVDNEKQHNSMDYRVEWFADKESAEALAKVKNSGKTRVCKPRSEETKARMRAAREKRKTEKKK